MKTVSAAVTARREELGFTQTEVAKRSGISQASISDIEAGATPRNSTLAKIAKALDCQPTDLDPTYTLGGRNNRTRRSDARPPKVSVDPELLLLLDGIAGGMAVDFGFVPSHVQVIQFLAKNAGVTLPEKDKGKTTRRPTNPSVERD
jgi:transcriptional regulator with XRE-family HTH domain